MFLLSRRLFEEFRIQKNENQESLQATNHPLRKLVECMIEGTLLNPGLIISNAQKCTVRI